LIYIGRDTGSLADRADADDAEKTCQLPCNAF